MNLSLPALTTAEFFQVATSFYMFGVIWIIQLIQYPSFASIDPSRFKKLHSHHSKMMSILVAPVMIGELFLAGWLWLQIGDDFSAYNLSIVILLWMLTFLVSVPIHNRLAIEFDLKAIHKLARTNWPRTILWTIKALGTSFWLAGKASL